ncbi:hypothetical protein V2J09_017583 [Rumex salicifolius]
MESNINSNSKGFTLDGTVDLRGRPVLASKTGKWKACAFLVTYEVFERMAFYGIASNLVVYLTTQLHEDTVSSVRNVNNWSGSVWMTPIAGAYVADAYLGRFWTFTLFSIIYVLGMAMLTMAVSLKSMKPSCHVDMTPTSSSSSPCISKATPGQVAFFYTALYTIVVGAGCTKPNISTFGADQFDALNPQEKQLKTSFFNWWMFSAFLGALFANLGLVYIQENLGWSLGYAIPTVGLTLSLVAFYVGSPFYRHKPRAATTSEAAEKEEGFYCKSPGKEIVGVVLGVLRNWWVRVPDDPRLLHEVDSCSYVRVVTQVEKTKLILGMLMIWLTVLIPSIIWAQVNTLFVKQGTTLDRRMGGSSFQIPAASLSSFITITLLFAVPLYDRYFVPFMRRRTGNPRGITLLQRLAIGCIAQIFSVIRAEKILGPKETVPMSIMWLLPQYILLGIGDVFNAIGLLEFFYDQSPDDMQSLGTTFFTSAIGVGNFLNGLLITTVDKVTNKVDINGRRGKSWIGNNLNDSHLDYYYGFLVVIALLNLGLFFWACNTYVYKKEVEDNELEVGESKNICVVEEKI